MSISKIDKNFSVRADASSKYDICFYNADTEPFSVCGIFKENGKYRRIPEDVAKKVSDGVYVLHTNTAGGRVRFITDSPYVAIRADMDQIGRMSHFTLAGAAGFDLYADNVYVNTYVPPYDMKTGYESVIDIGESKLREITVNFPPYSNVSSLYIGLKEGSFIGAPTPYKSSSPIVYYGSSITQGGCVSRPGMTYQSIISRRYGYDYINLGFSGNARAEDEIIDYICSLDMSMFVLDYDHNAPSVEHLKNTHEKMFMAVRKANPSIPIIMMSRPRAVLTSEEEERAAIINTTYKKAVESGDKNVYFLNGTDLCVLCGNEGTVDACHPTDFGFASMAHAICELIDRENIELE